MIKHSEEFKQEAVRIALNSGLPRARVAADLGLGSRRWGSGWQTIVLLTWCRHRKPTLLWRMNVCALRTVS